MKKKENNFFVRNSTFFITKMSFYEELGSKCDNAIGPGIGIKSGVKDAEFNVYLDLFTSCTSNFAAFLQHNISTTQTPP
ncbi:hypothetical protein LCGC14_1456540 [marine sediment metagenome]|uniref:Uncharacterized protein n=1 Tax=marine sediment metagenome TaxID=412755 RepID=A0A0F9K2H2_9ZZZZ